MFLSSSVSLDSDLKIEIYLTRFKCDSKHLQIAWSFFLLC